MTRLFYLHSYDRELDIRASSAALKGQCQHTMRASADFYLHILARIAVDILAGQRAPH